MRKLTYILPFFIGMLSLTGCETALSKKQNQDAVLEVAGKYLYKSDLQQAIPPGSSAEDSAAIADHYIRQWAISVLMYEKADRNISNTEEIEALVEDYRKSLLIHEYEEQLINQRMKPVSEADIQEFYENYASAFTIQDDILKGILLVIPQDAPQQQNVRKWLADAGNTKSLERIEKYTLQYAIGYDFFLDRWVSLGQIQRDIPAVSLPQSLQKGLIERSDSTRLYLLKVEEVRHKGDNMPYEYAKPEIENVLRNRKKVEFLQAFEDELYIDALNHGRVNFLNTENP